MDSICKQSQWISGSKTRAANTTILTVLLIWSEDTLLQSLSKKKNNDDWKPKLINIFTYQNPDSSKKYAQTVLNNVEEESDEIFGYCRLIDCKQWTTYIRDPFNKYFCNEYVEFNTPVGNTKNSKKQLSHPIQSRGLL